MGYHRHSDQYYPGQLLVTAGGLTVTLAAVVLYLLEGTKYTCDSTVAACIQVTITYSLLDYVVITAYGLTGLSIAVAVWSFVWSRRFVWAALVVGGAALFAPLFLILPLLSFNPPDIMLPAYLLFVSGGVAILVGVARGRAAPDRISS